MINRDIDLRLGFPLLAVWIGCLSCFGLVARSPILVGLSIAAVALLVAQSPSRERFAVIGVFVLLGILIAAAAWRIPHSARIDEVLAATPVSHVTFRVTSDATISGSTGFSQIAFEQSLRFSADVIALDGRQEYIPVLVSTPIADTPAMASIWSCDASFRRASGATRFAAFMTCRRPPTPIASPPRFQTMATSFRASLQALSTSRHPDIDGARLLPGLVLGDTTAQTEAVTTALIIAGLGHLTAVSGANVAIVVGAMAWLLRFTRLSVRWRYALLIITVLAFMIVARPSASVVRASVMAAIALTVWLMGAQRRADTAVLGAGLILLLIDPWLALSWGFALSLAATLGLVLLPKFWGVTAQSPRWQRAIAAAAAAALATTPILIAMGSTPTFATIPANIAAEVLVAPATVLGVLAAVAATVNLDPVAWLCADVATVFAHGIVLIATAFAQSPLAVSILGWQGFLFAALGIWWWRYRPTRTVSALRVFMAFCLAFAVMNVRAQAVALPSAWELFVCDVGQGDAALINLGGGSAMLVDAGPDAHAIDTCLVDAGITRIELFVASHFHQDHVGGVQGVLRHDRRIVRALTSRFAQPTVGATLVAHHSDTRPEAALPGMSGELNGVSWQVLLAELPDAPEADGTTINSSSVVLLVQTAHWRVLFTGDIEVAAQERLMQAAASPRVDIIKVPHHGSRSQSAELPRWSAAQIAWVSVGADNPYGHPNAETIAMYRAAGMTVLMTRDCGEIFATPNRSVATSHACQSV